MKEIVKNTLILLIITLVAGVCLGLVFEVTKTARAEQEEKTTQASYRAVFEDADHFTEMAEYDAEAMSAAIAEKGVEPTVAGVTGIIEAFDADGGHLGYVFIVESYKGYGGTIKFSVGIQDDGTVNGYSLLSISETAGLGQKAKESKFKDQFNGKNVDSFVWTKSGATEDNEIDAISAATITTKAMTNGMNAALYAFQYLGEVD